MNLFELPQTVSVAKTAAPTWVCGCFVRRSITFFTGMTDTTTLVVWVQSRGLTFDLRLAPGRPRVRSIEQLRELPLPDVLRFAEAEGGLAHSKFSAGAGASGTMDWGDWVRLQLHDGWPEPGELRRVGDCLTEFAPSGAYVEDWRLQSSSKGALVGLELVSEVDVDSGELLYSGGGLVVAGDHAGLVRGRPVPLPATGRLVDVVRASDGDRGLWSDVFRFEASYAVRSPSGGFVVAASTLPFREGEPLMSLEGFTLDGDVVVQRAREAGRDLERRFRLETREPFDAGRSSGSLPEAGRWLIAEASTLLRSAR